MIGKPPAIRDNQDVFRTVEFSSWSNRADLDADERYLISTYLDPTRRTLEAGTGGGRILLAMMGMGFSSLSGFDFVPELIAEARRRDASAAIDFQVQDATQLTYADASFDQLIYLQQVICFMEGEDARRRALKEAIRILRPGGTALFSLLSFEVRSRSPLYSLFLTYLRVLRVLRGASRNRQTLPWLRLGGRFNFASLLDRGPRVYWYRVQEAAGLLQDVGFTLRAIGTSRQIKDDRLHTSPDTLCHEGLAGTLYCVCAKPS